MPSGFSGVACQKYLTMIGTAMTSAHSAHSSPPVFAGTESEAPPPALPATPNHNPPHSPETANMGGYSTGVGNQSNIVVKQNDYDEVLRKIQMTDAKIAEEIYNLAIQIEEMCETIYIVPQMRPKYLEYTIKAKSWLSAFQSLADDARTSGHQFVSEVVQIDRS